MYLQRTTTKITHKRKNSIARATTHEKVIKNITKRAKKKIRLHLKCGKE